LKRTRARDWSNVSATRALPRWAGVGRAPDCAGCCRHELVLEGYEACGRRSSVIVGLLKPNSGASPCTDYSDHRCLVPNGDEAFVMPKVATLAIPSPGCGLHPLHLALLTGLVSADETERQPMIRQVRQRAACDLRAAVQAVVRRSTARRSCQLLAASRMRRTKRLRRTRRSHLGYHLNA